MPTELRTCPSCRGERLFETPPCPDGHGSACPEFACVECGTALLVAPQVPVRRSGRQARPEPAGAAPDTAALSSAA
jgi:hypothetical protein